MGASGPDARHQTIPASEGTERQLLGARARSPATALPPSLQGIVGLLDGVAGRAGPGCVREMGSVVGWRMSMMLLSFTGDRQR